MSDTIDLAALSGSTRRAVRMLRRVRKQRGLDNYEASELAEAEDLLALVRAVRAAFVLIHPTPEQLRDPMFLHRAGEGLRSELEAFTDSGRGTAK